MQKVILVTDHGSFHIALLNLHNRMMKKGRPYARSMYGAVINFIKMELSELWFQA